jgi:hypothetical protein
MSDSKGGRPSRYVGKRTRSYTLTDEAHGIAQKGAQVADVTASDLVETLIRRHTEEAVQYLKGQADAEATTGDTHADPACRDLPHE